MSRKHELCENSNLDENNIKRSMLMKKMRAVKEKSKFGKMSNIA
jgi:hypothetical protein